MRIEANRIAIEAEHRGVKIRQLIGSPGLPPDEFPLGKGFRAAVRRSFHPAGTMRQMAAVAADRRT